MPEKKGSFRCQECSFVANRKSSLRDHVANKHEGLRLVCPYMCGKTFSCRGSRSVHARKYCSRRTGRTIIVSTPNAHEVVFSFHLPEDSGGGSDDIHIEMEPETERQQASESLDSYKAKEAKEAGDSDQNLPVRAVRTSAEPIDISSFLSPEEQQQFESEAVAVAGSFPKTVSNVIDTSGISVSQDYLNNKTELDRQCNELMVSSYDSSVGRAHSINRINKQSHNLLILGKTVWQCAQCHYSSKLRYTVKEHVETHISGFSHQCPLCDKTCNTRNALRVHTIRKHSNKVAKQVQQNMLSLPPPS